MCASRVTRENIKKKSSISFCFLNGGYVFLGRKWEDLEDLWKKITTFYSCGDVFKLLVWDANLGFEHSFISKRLVFWMRNGD